MIGKWNKSVILTYIGVCFGIYGIYISEINTNKAMIALVMAGICDMFDGTIARMCKRTEEEKNFGIQLDSLADVVSFAILPTAIVMNLMSLSIVNFIGCAVYVIFGVARLAYFNITVESGTDKAVKFYHGLPITYIAFTLPITYTISLFVIPEYSWFIAFATLLFTGILFIVDIHVKKIKPKAYIFFVIIAILVIGGLVVKL